MFVFVDTETTGFPRGGVQPRIVSIAWMLADDANAPRVFKCSMVRPEGFAIPAGAAAVHGISTERALVEGRPLRDVLADFADDVKTLRPRSLVAHNARFDLPIIEAEFARTGQRSPCAGLGPFCTMLAARRRWPGESARLGEVYRRLFGAEMRDAHDAGADVRACARIFFALHGSHAAPSPAGPCVDDRPEEDWAGMVEAVLLWAESRSGFDAGFVESLRDRLDSGRSLTSAQEAALRRIIERWRIPV